MPNSEQPSTAVAVPEEVVTGEIVRPADELVEPIRAAIISAENGMVTGMEHYAEAGELLAEAKASLEHGAWLPWLREHFELSARTARRYMRLAANWTRVSDLPSAREAIKLLREDSDSDLTPEEQRLLESNIRDAAEDRRTCKEAAAQRRKEAAQRAAATRKEQEKLARELEERRASREAELELELEPKREAELELEPEGASLVERLGIACAAIEALAAEIAGSGEPREHLLDEARALAQAAAEIVETLNCGSDPADGSK